MKIIKNIFTIAILILTVLAACDKELDIRPEQSIDSDQVYSTSEGVITALNGAYERISGAMTTDGLQSGELYGGTLFFFSDLLGDDGKGFWGGTFIEYRNMFNKTLDPNDYTVRDLWLRGYDAINITNNVLANLEMVNEAERNRVEGEAKFIRGIVYFDLVRLFAKQYNPAGGNTQLGIPLVTTPSLSINDDSYVSRNSVEEIYTQVIQDLTDAESRLSNEGIIGPDDNNGYASSLAASAFLARVYLQMSDYQNAAEKANTVISSGMFGLNGTPLAAFNNEEYTSEDIFMIKQNVSSNAGSANSGLSTFFSSLPGEGRSDLTITPSFFAMFETGDRRANIDDSEEAVTVDDVTELYYIGTGQNSGSVNCAKWGKYDRNIPVIRLAEMYLTRAEANFENGTSIGAAPVDDINTTRRRAGLINDLTSVTRAQIRQERQLELAWEGHRLHDAKRWQETVAGISWDADRLVLPIPQRELDANPNLEPNPGYN